MTITEKFIQKDYSSNVLDKELLPAIRAIQNALKEKNPNEKQMASDLLKILTITTQYDGPDIAEVVAEIFFERQDLLKEAMANVSEKDKNNTISALRFGWNLVKERLEQTSNSKSKIIAFNNLLEKLH
ncbi:MAG: hypothetical protein ACOY3I_07275 [Verrucomicrobiota bacterium]